MSKENSSNAIGNAPLQNFHEEITIEGALVLNGTRIIIPTSQRQKLLKQLHAGNLVYKHGCTGPSKPYTNLQYMIKFMSLL